MAAGFDMPELLPAGVPNAGVGVHGLAVASTIYLNYVFFISGTHLSFPPWDLTSSFLHVRILRANDEDPD